MDVVSQQIEPPNCDKTLNIQIKTASDGKAVASWETDDRFINGLGIVMGGFVSSAADITMAYAVSSLLNEDQSFGSINLSTTFHRPVVVGKVDIDARVERIGKTIAYVVADLMQNDKKVASVTSSVIILTAK
ncbi:thioesterase [Salipaludibacillus keqinensis]|uniref:Thioesterase n=1 Tax=Salipaludibacillus keqinensis TaxID=2045207 RepID=A0A323TMQ6_9BACI|nr:PaaI family thioesterase [Salipaludibacillus keqinensis]PYZ95346.1 thioesterase [Salipaludibacillus keqinensis]